MTSSQALGLRPLPVNEQPQVSGFWAQDVWPMEQCPTLTESQVEMAPWTIEFGCRCAQLNTELKFGCRQKFMRGEWSATNPGWHDAVGLVVKWLNHAHCRATSLLEREYRVWDESLCAWLAKQNLQAYSQNHHRHLALTVLRQVYRQLMEAQADQLVWDNPSVSLERVGLASELTKTHGITRFNFSRIQPPWLATALRAYIGWRSSTLSYNTCRTTIDAVHHFSTFLAKFHPRLEAAGLDRAVIVEFLRYLAETKLSPTSRQTWLSLIRTFLELSSRERIVDFPEKRLIYDDDFPSVPTLAPRHIPPEVVAQLEAWLATTGLTRPTPPGSRRPHRERMIHLLLHCGMRVSELLVLPFRCLEKDSDGDWFIRYFQSKVRCEQTQPVTAATAAVIQAQQKDVRRQNESESPWLFPNPKGVPYTTRWFWNVLKEVQSIRQFHDANGHLWNFFPHQFRHTLGTTLINQGMSMYEVQLMLGHKSPTMTQHYARVHHETLKQKYKAALEARTLVDLSGKVYREENPDDAAELRILKQGFTAQTLPHGWCAYPVALGNCPHANSCYSCRHWRTDQSKLPILQAHLAETQTLITQATEQGWQRVVEMNTTVAQNLTRVIQVLKGDDDGTSTQH